MRTNSTIIPRKQKLKCGHTDYNFSRGRCKKCATLESTAKRIAAKEQGEADESLQNLVEDADAIYSRYIRLRYADEKGWVKCFTCPNVLPVAQIQNGHFKSRANMATRYLDANCRPQCPACNRRHEEDESVFAEALERENKGVVAYLESKARETYKFSREELKALLAEWRWTVKLLEKKNKKT